MNPVSGGLLTEQSPVLIQAVQKATGCEDPVEVAHRYLAADTNVDTILCGITKSEDVISTIENFQKPALTAEQVSAVERVFEELSKENVGFCTECKYCMPCPQGINIPMIMHAVYLDKFLRVPVAARGCYNWFVHMAQANRSTAPAECTECGQCMDACPQHIQVPDRLKKVHDELSN